MITMTKKEFKDMCREPESKCQWCNNESGLVSHNQSLSEEASVLDVPELLRNKIVAIAALEAGMGEMVDLVDALVSGDAVRQLKIRYARVTTFTGSIAKCMGEVTDREEGCQEPDS